MWRGERREFFFFLVSLLPWVMTVAQQTPNSTIVSRVVQPLEEVTPYLGLSTCEDLKSLKGLSYKQLKGTVNEPDLNNLTLVYRLGSVTEVFYLNDAVEVLQRRNFNDGQDFILFLHGFTDDPYQGRFDIISEAYRSNGNMVVAALDAGPLLRDHYLRATTYVRFIGERLGKVLVDLVQHGQNPERIHLIGHSLGAHIAGFAGKFFYIETGMNICRITGLDPAAPCFGMEPDLQLKASDAWFVDAIHTDGGVYGTNDTLGHADYFPNGGSVQPSCSSNNLCAHERSWLLYAATVEKPQLFPSVKCYNWDDFKNDRCSDEISYMGFGAEPTTGKFYLRTSGEYPYGLGEEGLKYPLMRQSRTYITHFYNP